MSAIADFIIKSGKNYDLGLLILRIGFGINMALFHGWAKISGGPERWEGIGGSMANLGITFFRRSGALWPDSPNSFAQYSSCWASFSGLPQPYSDLPCW